MASGAHIRLDQTANPVPTGTYDATRLDLYEGQITLTGDSNGGLNTGPAWTLLSGPPGASLALSGANTFTASFNSVAGEYRVQLNVNDGTGANSITLKFVVSADVNGNGYDFGLYSPAFGELVGEDNASGNVQGYAAPYRKMRQAIVPVVKFSTTLLTNRANVHTSVQTSHYAVVGDGGGDIFDWDPASTAAHNAGRVWQPGFGTAGVLAVGRWIARGADVVNVRKYGMNPDTRKLTNVSVSVAGTSITSTSLVASDQGKAVQVLVPNNAATGTITTVASAATGTVSVAIGSNVVTGAGTAFLTETFVGGHIKIGSIIATVTAVTSNTSLKCNQSDWNTSASGLSMTRMHGVGTGTNFAADLFLGKGIYIGAVFYTVRAIGKINGVTDALGLWPVPNSDGGHPLVTGATIYKDPVTVGLIGAVNLGTHTAPLTLMSSAAFVANASNLWAYIGTDNSAAWNAARHDASALGRATYIPGAASHYMMFSAVDPLVDADRGCEIFGDGYKLTLDDPYGSPACFEIGTGYGSVLRFAKSDGIVINSGSCWELSLHGLALLGPGFGVYKGFGMTDAEIGVGGGALGSNKITKLMLANWRYGADLFSDFSSWWDNPRIIGNAVGARVNGTAQHWYNGDYSANGIAFLITGVQNFALSGSIQGNMITGVYITGGINLRFHDIYWENDAHAVGAGTSLELDISTNSIVNIAFFGTHSGDLYTLEPIGSGGAGSVAFWTDLGSEFNAVSFRPIAQNVFTSGKFSHFDRSALGGGLLCMGGAALGYAHDPGITQIVVNSGSTFTPDLTTHGSEIVLHLGGSTGTIHINAPTESGKALSSTFQHLRFRIRALSATPYVVTWDASYISNPWTDAGSGSGIDAAGIDFIHTGGGSVECYAYKPYPVTPPTFTVTNHTDALSLNETAATLVQVANTLGTVVKKLQAKGIFN